MSEVTSTATDDVFSVLDQYERDGVAIVRNAIDQDLIAEAREHIAWLSTRYPELRPEEMHHPLIRNDAFWTRLVTDPRIVDIAQAVLGPDLACFTAHYISKPPGDGQPVLWHQDGAFWNLEPMEAVSIWLAIDRSDAENGCLEIIPGSHVEPLHDPVRRLDTPNMLASETREEVINRWISDRGIMKIELNPGDLSFHHPNILHRSEPNTSDRRRCGLDMGFMSTSTRLSNEGLYIDPLLVRGRPASGINRYRPWPIYSPEESIDFEGRNEWDDTARSWNSSNHLSPVEYEESPLESAQKMIRRLHAGTVKR